MIAIFLHSFRSEWLKCRRTTAAWLTLSGGFFIPLIILGQRFYFHERLAKENSSPDIWEMLHQSCWKFMAFFLLPIGVMLATSLIGQLEYRNNTWKQLHVTPQPPTVIYFTKLSVILLMFLEFFILFNIGIFLTGMIPALVMKQVPFPAAAFPVRHFMYTSWHFFLACLPVLALQYAMSLHFRNFLISLGAGLGLYVFSLMTFRWEYGVFIPYFYTGFSFSGNPADPRIYQFALIYFAIFGTLGYLLFIYKKERG